MACTRSSATWTSRRSNKQTPRGPRERPRRGTDPEPGGGRACRRTIPPFGPRAVRRSDMSTIHRLYRTQTRGLLGWTERPERALEWGVIRTRDYLEKYRIVLRDGQAVGYLRTRPHDGITMEEVVAPNPQDFRAAVALMEAKAETGIATVNWITARSDVTRFRSLGYTVDGPFPDPTMAVSLEK